MSMEIIGVISDTHGLLRPEAILALAGCSRIIHAGDVADCSVGGMEVLEGLSRIAPVHAVRGNSDLGETSELPERARVDVGSHKILVQHYPTHPDLDQDFVDAGVAMVITGHTHKRKFEERSGVLFLNPGVAGPRSYPWQPLSVARLSLLADGSLKAELVLLKAPNDVTRRVR